MTSKQPNEAQAEFWAGDEGDHWAEHIEHYETMLAPFGERLIEEARFGEGQRVLDIGCGCGYTSIAAAQAVGADGSVLGVDLSPQMVDVARDRAERAGVGPWTRFEVADAQAVDFDVCDLVISRFGVMFFENAVEAFANIAGAIRPGGRIAFCCWQTLDKNDWMRIPRAAAEEYLEAPAAETSSTQPGPFSLGDPDRIRSLLGKAGVVRTRIEPFELDVPIARGGSLDDTVDYLVAHPSGREMLSDVDEQTRSKAIEAMRRALEPHHDGDGVRLPAAAWIVTGEIEG